MVKGNVFNIQKFSIHDGPGIRTTVFLKGCPLRCKWCSNPESQLEQVQILYDQQKCLHCLVCVNNCPNKAIKHIDNQIVIDNEKCIGCLLCSNNCPSHALSNEGSYKTVDEVLEICLQDIDFYEESNGGVTISGGEGMMQPVFVKELIAKLKTHHIQTAIETTGYIKSEIFQDLAKEFDLLLFDVKHYNSKNHLLGTGVDNKLIIENLTWAINNNINVLVRIPVIPEFNSTLQDAKGFVELFKNNNINKVQLLPFHQFGEKKYTLLNKEYEYKNKKALHNEDLEEYRQVFINEGIDCFF